jgi:hypothetical protein
VPISRSAISMPDASATDGIEKMIIMATTRIAQTKMGIRASVMPGARCLRMVATMTTAAASAEISVKVTICAQTSMRLPAEYSGPANGT